MSASTGSAPERVAIVVVTYNRADLLAVMLEGLARLERPADAVIVVDNASTDHTAALLERWVSTSSTSGCGSTSGGGSTSGLAGLQVVTSPENLGGAGGFHLGTRIAYEQGFDRIWLMDDDVVPAPDCLTVLLAQDLDHSDCLMAVRENTDGSLIELAATRFNLANPLAIKPKQASVLTEFGTRAAMPERVRLENVAFEGFMIRRRVIDAVGLPDASFFIFYDDVDFALRCRHAGLQIWAIRDARLVRQLDFSQQHDLSSWKGFYMYRNLFAVHFRYGENALVRLKPWLIALVVVLLSPVRGGRREAGNVISAVRAARAMRRVPPASVD